MRIVARVAAALRDPVEQRLLLGWNLIIPAEAAQLQALRDAQRGLHEADGRGRRVAPLDGLQEQRQPAAEMRGLDPVERLVRLLHVAAIALGAEHEARPEHHHLRQMIVPAAGELRVEHGPEQRIGAHAVVERVDEIADIVFGRLGVAGAGRCGLGRGGQGSHDKKGR